MKISIEIDAETYADADDAIREVRRLIASEHTSGVGGHAGRGFTFDTHWTETQLSLI